MIHDEDMQGDVYAVKMGEVRAVIGLPGWGVITEILRKRQALLQTLIMQPVERRAYPISDDRIRGEFLVIETLLSQPEKLLETYEAFLKESLASEQERPAWAELTNEFGMTRAGFPGQPGEMEEPR